MDKQTNNLLKTSETQNQPLLNQGDLRIARKIQAAMIPKKLPAAEGVDIQSLYLPCGAVGGDLFDVVRLSNDQLLFLIFDVTGQGISSTLISAMAKVCFSNHMRTSNSPRSIIERVNRDIMLDVDTNFFITAFVGILDLHDNKLTYSNAGHAYPIIYRKSESSLIPLPAQGTAIGIVENGYYDEHSIHLSPGDWFIAFTDGIYRLFDRENMLQGRVKFEDEILKMNSHSSPADFFSRIQSLFSEKNGSTPVEDDITAIAFEVLSKSKRVLIKEELGFCAEDPVYLQFVSYFEEMDRAVATVLTSMDTYGYPDESIRKMKITMTELLVNAIQHGNKRDFSKKVTIGHMVDKSVTVVSIMDEGDGFNPASVPDPTLPENLARDCGRGLYIVRHYVDDIKFNKKGNRITILKNYSTQ